MLDSAIDALKKDPDTQEFGAYFEFQYKATFFRWAWCYRLFSGINTNMFLEGLHGILKHLYLESKKSKRLDVAIDALMKLLRDQIFDRLITLRKGKVTHKMLDIRKKHKASLELSDFIIMVTKENLEWLVQSQSQMNQLCISS